VIVTGVTACSARIAAGRFAAAFAAGAEETFSAAGSAAMTGCISCCWRPLTGDVGNIKKSTRASCFFY